jgi:arylsulfatase A-like enzyme
MLSFTGFVALLHVRGGNKPVRPNIVVIMADDLGWANAGYHGSFIQTPSLMPEGI